MWVMINGIRQFVPLMAPEEGGQPPAGGGDGGGGDGGNQPPGGGDGGEPTATPPEGGSGTGEGEGGAPATPPEGGEGEGGDKPWYSALPENWRDQISKGDEKKLNVLARYSTPADVLDAFFEARDKIKKGEVSSGLPENPTEEQLKEYREANGIPEDPDGYELTLDDGLVLGDEDRKAFAPVFEAMHKANMPTSAVNEVVNSFLQGQAAEVERMQERDNLDAQETTATLKERWGADFAANKQLVNTLVRDMLPPDVVDAFMDARLPGGKAMFNEPSVLAGLAKLARELNPAATLVPADGDPRRNVETRIKELESQMSKDIDAWHKDKSAQQELRQLYDAREKYKSRG